MVLFRNVKRGVVSWIYSRRAVVTHDLDGQGKAEIPCEVMHAELLRDLALSIYPPAAIHIEDTIKVARQP